MGSVLGPKSASVTPVKGWQEVGCHTKGSRSRLRFVAFEPRGDEYVAFMEVRDALEAIGSDGEAEESTLFGIRAGLERELDELLAAAARLYRYHVEEMRGLVRRISQMRRDRVPLPASFGWKIGDAVFRLKDKLEEMFLEVDDLYGHLERDTGIPRPFLKRAVSFRRYLPDPSYIPCDATWNGCSRSPRKAALEMMRNNRPRLPAETGDDRAAGRDKRRDRV